PLRALLLLIPVAALAMSPGALSDEAGPPGPQLLMMAALVVSVGLGGLVLLTRTPIPQAMAAMGILAFGLPYFALPLASLYQLQQHDPWVLLLLLAIVWLGDTAAYYFGRHWGRRPLAPSVSPNKTWEGAAAGFAAGMAVAVVWSLSAPVSELPPGRLDRLSVPLLLLAALTSLAAQLGDLVESLIKRGAEVKDSGHLLPGHGGVWDRMDALLFAAPVMLLGVKLLGDEGLVP
ncbi:MAG: phosphatidate cytidylyltransferase, partial [Thermoanaerobaculia bacterium]